MKLRFSPSSASRWLNCTASPVYIAKNNLKSPPSKWANKGHDAHELAAEAILSNKDLEIKDPQDRQQHYAKEYVDYIMSLDYVWSMVERKVPNFYGSGNSIVDFVRYDGHNLHIVDFKSGWGLVPTEHNPQLLIYAVNIKEYIEWLGIPYEYILTQIFQPPKKYYEVCWNDKVYLNNFQSQVQDTVDNIKCESNLQFKPSKEACKF
jgi:hypothetical protein